jgi:hypothetical protein
MGVQRRLQIDPEADQSRWTADGSALDARRGDPMIEFIDLRHGGATREGA